MSTVPLPKKSLGQHWLEDETTLESIAQLADINKNDVVLEIGPGWGSLTKLLVQQANQVVAVELDRHLAVQLSTFINADNLSVVNESILKYDLTKLPADYKLVANIPYYLTSNLLRLLSESINPPSLIVLLIQKEVAQRVAAKAGSMSVLSVTTQYFWNVELKQIVTAKMFKPAPKVDSQVILLTRRKASMFPDIETRAFFRLVKVGFSARRKTLLNSISNGLRVDKATVSEILDSAKVDPGARPQTLNLDEWHEIYLACLGAKIL